MADNAALLTATQRDYLKGENKPDRSSHERELRTRIRNRLRDGISDFSILLEYLSAKDREMVFMGPRDSSEGDAEEQNAPETRNLHEGDVEAGSQRGWSTPNRAISRTSAELERGMVDAIAFFYIAASDASLDAKKLIEHGVRQGEEQLYDDRWIINDVSLEVDKDMQDHLASRALQKMQDGAELTNAEVRVLHTSKRGRASVTPEQIQGYLMREREPEESKAADPSDGD
ncbi:hypothetical protein C2R22_00120 [Salinigranum rubrum]|uniref:Domain of unknown function domain-containing protein n=1 Tax=Salinigranum rubrum TaxID=755307 RepID=A0A2I8VEA3_9EURY|nr:hypothetical protein [Salinigranum rubrum]AUV80263.1 hypothetical protein C2R22_00120 [Salinigranum rubrum]